MIGGVGAARIDVDIFSSGKVAQIAWRRERVMCAMPQEREGVFFWYSFSFYFETIIMMAPRKRPHFCFFVKWRVLVGRHVWPMYWNEGIVTKIYNQLHNTPTTITIFLSPHFHHTHPPPSNVLRSTCGHSSRPLIALNVISTAGVLVVVTVSEVSPEVKALHAVWAVLAMSWCHSV